MKIKEVELFKRRAMNFLEYAKIQLEDGVYDLSSFSSEQSVQLYVTSSPRLRMELPAFHRVLALSPEAMLRLWAFGSVAEVISLKVSPPLQGVLNAKRPLNADIQRGHTMSRFR